MLATHTFCKRKSDLSWIISFALVIRILHCIEMCLIHDDAVFRAQEQSRRPYPLLRQPLAIMTPKRSTTKSLIASSKIDVKTKY